MALRDFLCFCALVLVALSVQSHQAYGHGSSRGSFSPDSAPTETMTSQWNGICDSWVIKHGYKCQETYVTTKDGYKLNMQRIEGRDAINGDIKKQPVLLQHGIMLDGMSWLMNQPEQNLPFILADSGFDVWIANARGTRFCRQHTTLHPSQKEYWNWSWDQLAAYDLPAFVEFVYNQTGQKVNYIGHSLGTLTALVSLSQGLVVDKVKSTVLLSPIAYMSHLKTLLVDAAAKTFLGELGNLIGLAEFNLKGKAAEMFLRSFCATPGVNCYDYVTVLTGKNCCLNASTVDLVLKNEPQSTSIKNLVHLAQIIREKVIAKYDGSFFYNMKTYMAAKPPVYNISNIPHDHPLFLSYGGNDALSVVEDVKYLIDILSKSHDADKLKVQYVENYGHIDFIMAVNAKDFVYNKVVSFFKAQN